jgi:hypothetical protein
MAARNGSRSPSLSPSVGRTQRSVPRSLAEVMSESKRSPSLLPQRGSRSPGGSGNLSGIE